MVTVLKNGKAKRPLVKPLRPAMPKRRSPRPSRRLPKIPVKKVLRKLRMTSPRTIEKDNIRECYKPFTTNPFLRP